MTIPDELRRSLIEVILRVPLAEQHGGRTTLVAAIPQSGLLSRVEGNAHGDVRALVLQLEGTFGPDGEWRLLQLVDSALPTVAGTDTGAELLKLRIELERERGRRASAHPADVAQVHLFDLVQPVNLCAAMLPPEPALSGFVLPAAAAQPLLRHFCESLRHRGAALSVWARNEVAPARPVLDLDPRHTSPAVAVASARKLAPLLARQHAIWSAYVRTEADAAEVWRGLKDVFPPPLSRRLIVILGMPPGLTPPEGMGMLPAPRFTRQDIERWVGEIVKAVRCEAALTGRWALAIARACGDPAALPIESVYHELERHRELLAQNRTPEELGRVIDQELELLGE